MPACLLTWRKASVQGGKLNCEDICSTCSTRSSVGNEQPKIPAFLVVFATAKARNAVIGGYAFKIVRGGCDGFKLQGLIMVGLKLEGLENK